MLSRIVIANTSPLLYLHQANCLDLLWKLYNRVIVPPAVVKELEVGAQEGVNVPNLHQLQWVEVRPVVAAAVLPVIVDLGPGESEVIALGIENPNSLLIIDDQLARKIATLNNLTYTGTLGVLLSKFPKSLLTFYTAENTEKTQRTRRWLRSF